MLKLVHALDVNFSSVLEYYNSFKDKWRDLNCYAVYLADEGFDKYLDWVNRYEKNMYYLIDENNPEYIIGYGSIDYRTRSDTGQIGYGIKPSERNKGYGTLLLGLLLDQCKKLGMREVCISCLEENIASKRVIEKNNGFFEKRFFNHDGGNYGLKYWISLCPEIVYEVPKPKEEKIVKKRSLCSLLNLKFK